MKWDVSIGIPVYNGEDRLEYLLESLVKNHSGVKEIIVSDNASTDKTPEICQKYIENYPNLIRYVRQKKLIPAYNNFKETMKYASGKYFMIIGHHDMISENYFDELVPMLEDNYSAVAAVSMIYSFKDGMSLNEANVMFNPCQTKIASHDKRERLYAVLANCFTFGMINQLYKIDAIRQISNDLWRKEYIHSDCVQPIYTALLGECCVSEEAGYYYYDGTRNSETPEEKKARYEKNMQIKLHDVSNSNGYIPKLNWELCKKYAADLADDVLYSDVEISGLLNWIACYESEYSIAYNEIVYGRAKNPNRRAYNAIYLALKDERRRLVYQKNDTGSLSIFRGQAERMALFSYKRMLEILVNEGYLYPKYKLGRAESDLFTELMNLKAESRACW